MESLKENLKFFAVLVFISFIIWYIWIDLGADAFARLILLLLVVSIFGFYSIYFRYRYRFSKPFDLIHGWHGDLIFFLVACFTIRGFAGIYCQLSLTSNTQIIQGDMQTCIYFSALTLVGVSYGDVLPTQDSRLFAASQAILGYFFFALLVSVIIDAFKSR